MVNSFKFHQVGKKMPHRKKVLLNLNEKKNGGWCKNLVSPAKAKAQNNEPSIHNG